MLKSGETSHHIVGDTSKKAAEARAILAKHGIHVDDSVNGVFLPNRNNIDSSIPGILHNGKHPNVYFEGVNRLIREADKAGGKQAVLKTLDRIRNQLQSLPRDAKWIDIFG
ncbi:hypothetical protein EGJ52_14105 [Pseudomonas luteola]|uniref:AHH domain-containing protein n=1 Tax=Pseudomonas luteola TaxID=47886 RepID=UPI000F7B4B81|nr:AHH domain-containing protein [Pseudomonas luteola]RRW43247.1 hypothetical protein EGJ52_14105 [Pseudomonas luteola]